MANTSHLIHNLLPSGRRLRSFRIKTSSRKPVSGLINNIQDPPRPLYPADCATLKPCVEFSGEEKLCVVGMSGSSVFVFV